MIDTVGVGVNVGGILGRVEQNGLTRLHFVECNLTFNVRLESFLLIA